MGSPGRPGGGAVDRILIIAPNWVGDSLFMLPAVSSLRRRYAAARFTLLARPGICALMAGSPLFDERVPLLGRGRLARFAAHWALRSRRFDMALVLPPSFSSGLAARLSGARLRYGFGGQGRWLWLNRRLPAAQADRSRPVAEEYLDLARLAGAEPEPQDRQPRLPVTQEGAEEQNRLFREQGLAPGPTLIALCPTSAFGPSKRWPARHYAALARKLKELRYQPYVLAAPQEAQEARALSELAGGLPVLLPGLPGLAACLEKSAAVVANDSGPLHVAAAVGARALGLYGPVDPKWSAPQTHRASVLYRGEPCSPCHAQDCPLKHHDCLEKILPEEALAALMELLKR